MSLFRICCWLSQRLWYNPRDGIEYFSRGRDDRRSTYRLNKIMGWKSPHCRCCKCRDNLPLTKVSHWSYGISKNASFAIWPDLWSQLCAAIIPQYIKYSEIPAALFGIKSLAQIIKKEFIEDAFWEGRQVIAWDISQKTYGNGMLLCTRAMGKAVL